MVSVKVGYIRTSKKDQHPELQRRYLLAAGCEKVFEEQTSSHKAEENGREKTARQSAVGASPALRVRLVR